MKNIRFLSLYLLLTISTLSVLSGCKKNQDDSLYHFSITNSTGQALNSVDSQTGQIYKLGTGSTTISSNQLISHFTIVAVEPTAKKYTFEQMGEHDYNVYGYDNDIEYRFAGSAVEAKISYISNIGEKAYANRVVLPHWVAYKDFTTKNCGMETENLQELGTVTVEIFFKGKLIKQASAPKRAAASANINGGAF